MTLRDIIVHKKKSKSEQEPKIVYTSGVQVAVDFIGDASVLGRAGYVWVKENGQDSGVFQCYSPSVRHTAGIPVIIAHQPTKPLRRRVIDVDWDKLSDESKGEPYSLSLHARTHEWPTMKPGSDAVYVFPRALVPFKVSPVYPDLAFSVASGYYIYNGEVDNFPGLGSWYLTDSLPLVGGNYMIVLVYFNPSTNAIEVAEGIESSDILPTYPDVPTNMLPLAYIRLANGQTTLSEADFVDDGRPLFTFGSSVVDITTNMNNANALLEAEFDFALTRHIVSGG